MNSGSYNNPAASWQPGGMNMANQASVDQTMGVGGPMPVNQQNSMGFGRQDVTNYQAQGNFQQNMSWNQTSMDMQQWKGNAQNDYCGYEQSNYNNTQSYETGRYGGNTWQSQGHQSNQYGCNAWQYPNEQQFYDNGLQSGSFWGPPNSGFNEPTFQGQREQYGPAQGHQFNQGNMQQFNKGYGSEVQNYQGYGVTDKQSLQTNVLQGGRGNQLNKSFGEKQGTNMPPGKEMTKYQNTAYNQSKSNQKPKVGSQVVKTKAEENVHQDNSSSDMECDPADEEESQNDKQNEASVGQNSAAEKAPRAEEEQEDGDDNDEDTSFCKLCQSSFQSTESYFRHTRGLLHTQRQMAGDEDKKRKGAASSNSQSSQPAQKKPVNTSAPQQSVPQIKDRLMVQAGYWQTAQEQPAENPAAVATSQKAEQDKQENSQINSAVHQDEQENFDENEEEYWEEEGDNKEEPGEYRCALCDINTTGAVSLRAHLNGRNHKLVQDAVNNGSKSQDKPHSAGNIFLWEPDLVYQFSGAPRTSLPKKLAIRLGPKAQVPQLKNSQKVDLTAKPGSGPSVLLDLLKNIPEAIVGVKCVKEFMLGRQLTFLCTICESQCDSSAIQTHLMGSKHRMKYLREHHWDIYQHVKAHGGKKSQLSSFLEEVCSDIERKEGRGEPIFEAPDVSTEEKKDQKTNEESNGKNDEKNDEKKPAETPKKAEEKHKESRISGDSDTSSYNRRLPHEVVLARYKEEKKRKEMIEQGLLDPRDEDPGWDRGRPAEFFDRRRGRHWDPDFGHRGRDFGPRDTDFGPRGLDYRRRDPDFERRGPDFGPERFHTGENRGYLDRGQHSDWERREFYSRFRQDPRVYMSEEERSRLMFAYERQNFFYPEIGLNPEEARRRMFMEYERLGVPYEIACHRVILQENRMIQLVDYLRDGLSLEEAQQKVITTENRQQLIREYERQGLSPREARWRVVVEEERAKLFEEFEGQGLTPSEARAHVMAGKSRMHFSREFERRGMPPEEALQRAIAEETRLKRVEDSLKKGLGERDGGSQADNILADIAERKMLENFLKQGLSREEAENKVIAHLRQQGVPTQEAIMRVQKIEIQVLNDPDVSDVDKVEKGRSPRESEFDNITPEQAKERLLYEYERRGVPREEARKILISELIRTGVPPDEAERRFQDSKISADQKEKSKTQQKAQYTGYDQSQCISSSNSEDDENHSSTRISDRGDGTGNLLQGAHLHHDGQSLARGGEKYQDQSGKYQLEYRGRPTLTLGEELRLRKLKREGGIINLADIPSKQGKQAALEKLSAQYAASRNASGKGDVPNLLESLTNNLISSEDDAAMALQVSKALTSALLKYRLKSVPAGKEEQMASQSSFVEKRIEDAKKLFASKMSQNKNPSSSSKDTSQGSPSVRPESFGLPPPLAGLFAPPQPASPSSLPAAETERKSVKRTEVGQPGKQSQRGASKKQ